MNKTLYLFVSVLALNLSGCASIISGKNDLVRFNSSPSGANISIQDENNKVVYKGITPATVTLERGDGFFDGQSYTIDYAKKGYENKSYTLNTTMNGWYAGNLLAGGLVGIVLIDPATGAMWDLPESVDNTLIPLSYASEESEDGSVNPRKKRKSKHKKH